MDNKSNKSIVRMLGGFCIGWGCVGVLAASRTTMDFFVLALGLAILFASTRVK